MKIKKIFKFMIVCLIFLLVFSLIFTIKDGFGSSAVSCIKDGVSNGNSSSTNEPSSDIIKITLSDSHLLF